MALFKIFNGPFPTTAAQLPVTTGTAIKTLLQVKGVADMRMKIKAWGLSFDASAAATPGKCELVETGTIFGTVTASAAGDIVPQDAIALAATSTTYFSVGTSATGYTCTSEGSIVATREFDSVLLPPTGPYLYEWSLGNEPVVQAVSALRIRVTFGAAINALAWVLVEV